MSDCSSSSDESTTLTPAELKRVRDQAEEVEALFGHRSFRVEKLYERGLGNVTQTAIRSVVWKIFLGLLSLPPSGADLTDIHRRWETDVERSRKLYKEIKEKHAVDPHKNAADDDDEEALAIDNPLSDHENCQWSVFFKQKLLIKDIDKDLMRMSSGGAMWDRPDIRSIMKDVLRLFALENPTIGYRQGMHDLLSAFVYFLVKDARWVKHASEEHKQGISEEVLDLIELAIPVDHDDITSDAYTMLGLLMTSPSCNLQAWFLGQEGGRRIPSSCLPIVAISNRLQNEVLTRFHPALAQHLLGLGIEATVYALRWFRLLFLREFEMGKVAVLWDAILCEAMWRRVSGNLDPNPPPTTTPFEDGLLPLIAGAMLVYLAKDLLQRDYAMTVKRLMKYPPVEDVYVFVEKALEWSNSALRQYSRVKPVDPSPASTRPASPPIPNSIIRMAAPAAKAASPSTPNSPAGRTVAQMLEQQKKLGAKLESIINTFQSKWFEHEEKPKRSPEENMKLNEEYLLAIAELKQVKDVLLGGIPQSPTLSMHKPSEKSRPAFPPSLTGK